MSEQEDVQYYDTVYGEFLEDLQMVRDQLIGLEARSANNSAIRRAVPEPVPPLYFEHLQDNYGKSFNLHEDVEPYESWPCWEHVRAAVEKFNAERPTFYWPKEPLNEAEVAWLQKELDDYWAELDDDDPKSPAGS